MFMKIASGALLVLAILAAIQGSLIGALAFMLPGLILLGKVLSKHNRDLAVQEWAVNADREQARQWAQQREELSVKNYLELSDLIKYSNIIAIELPSLVQAAERSLDLAESEFAEGVFAPFWDAIESSAKHLAVLDSKVQKILENSRRHKELLHEDPAYQILEVPGPRRDKPPFRLDVNTLPDATFTAERMRKIVRRAQKHPDFAKIYEMRKTNQLLVTGFSTLGQAINELGGRLDASLDSLSSAVSISIEETQSELRSKLDETREVLEQESKARREHEAQELKMLDNIQRRRKPLP